MSLRSLKSLRSLLTLKKVEYEQSTKTGAAAAPKRKLPQAFQLSESRNYIWYFFRSRSKLSNAPSGFGPLIALIPMTFSANTDCDWPLFKLSSSGRIPAVQFFSLCQGCTSGFPEWRFQWPEVYSNKQFRRYSIFEKCLFCAGWFQFLRRINSRLNEFFGKHFADVRHLGQFSNFRIHWKVDFGFHEDNQDKSKFHE